MEAMNRPERGSKLLKNCVCVCRVIRSVTASGLELAPPSHWIFPVQCERFVYRNMYRKCVWANSWATPGPATCLAFACIMTQVGVEGGTRVGLKSLQKLQEEEE